MRCALLTVAAATAFGCVHAAVVEHWWNITYVEDINPDGLFPRRVIGVNGTWPPPIVELNSGDSLIINAYNGLPDWGTTLHSHGIFFNGSSYFDGAAGVTQCPIPPGETLRYVIPTDNQWGTFWIHGHFNGQYVDGLRTPFIIHPLQQAQQYDDEYTITLGDWYHSEHPVLLKQFLSMYNPTGAEPIPDSAVVYVAHNNSYVNSIEEIGQGVGVSAADNMGAVLNFEPGKTYRLRFLNMGAFTMFNIHIEGHNTAIIEMDGVDTEPYPVDIIPLSVAQRISVLVTARNDTRSNFPITFYMDGDMLDTIPDNLVLNVTAQIVYSDNAPLEPATVFDEYPVFWDTDLVPFVPEAMALADVSYNFTIAFDTYDDGFNHASLLDSQSTYMSPLVPSIFTQLTIGQDAYLPQIYGQQTNAFVLNHMDNIELNIFNSDSNSHPFHLHGHHFQVVYMSQDVSSNDTSDNPPLVEGLTNPSRRDVIMIPAGGSVRIRFRADNPGTWLFHCHIEWHLEAGLAVVFVEAPTQAQESLTLPQALMDQCKAQGVPTTGNVVGLNSTTDFTGEPWGPFTQWHIIGWTVKAKGAMAGCILSALAGIASVIWYSMGAVSMAEREEIEREHFEKKKEKIALAYLRRAMKSEQKQ